MTDTSSRPPRSWTPIGLGANVAAPAGAYSAGVRAGDFLFVSGQIPKDPTTGEMAGDDIESQTRQVIRNVAAVLEAGGSSLVNVVSATVYLTDPDHWGQFNAVYRDLMPPPYPARAAVGATLRGILVEISVVAYVPVGRNPPK